MLEVIGPECFLEWTRGADLCFPNLEEGMLLTGFEDPDRVAQELLSRYSGVAFKLGPGGALYAGADGERARLPAASARVVDTARASRRAGSPAFRQPRRCDGASSSRCESPSTWEVAHGQLLQFKRERDTYADVLGEEGLVEYRRLAAEQWAHVRALGPGEEDPRRYGGERFRITHIMETLARQEGDVEALVGVLSRDLSSPHAYLRIAQTYKEAGESEKALEWAEEAMWVFPDEVHSGLREFLAREYHHRGRHEEATQLMWPQFARSPRLESYKELKHHAERAGRWEEWRNKALGYLRKDIARRIEESRHTYLSLPVNHSQLVRIFLWEGDVEAAWREAQEGSCSEELWLEFAARREEEHPEEALAIYEKRIEPLIEQTNNAAYKAAYELLVRVRDLMRRLDRQAEFEEYLELLRSEYKRKRNLMKLLEQI